MASTRYAELDALRGLAVLMMIFYHVLFDLSYFSGWNLDVTTVGWKLFAHATAAIFLLVIGACFVLSWERTQKNERWKKSIRRAFIVFGGGMIVTVATSIITPDSFVVFGILHLIGVSAILQPFFRPLRGWNIAVGCFVILVGMFLPHTIDSYFLLPFGIPYPGFMTIDYYPLLPWFGFILIGMGLGDLLYIPEQSERLRTVTNLPYPRWLLWTGRRALLIYLVHQPLILLLLWAGLGR